MSSAEFQQYTKDVPGRAVRGLAYAAAITRMGFDLGAEVARYGDEEINETYVSNIFTKHGNGD